MECKIGGVDTNADVDAKVMKIRGHQFGATTSGKHMDRLTIRLIDNI